MNEQNVQMNNSLTFFWQLSIFIRLLDYIIDEPIFDSKFYHHLINYVTSIAINAFACKSWNIFKELYWSRINWLKISNYNLYDDTWSMSLKRIVSFHFKMLIYLFLNFCENFNLIFFFFRGKSPNKFVLWFMRKATADTSYTVLDVVLSSL